MFEEKLKKADNISSETVAKSAESDIIKSKEMVRAKSGNRKTIHAISDKRFDDLTIEAKKNGATILRGGEDIEEHLNSVNANASTIGDVLMFREDVTISEVLEETHHFMQNINHLNDSKGEPLRTILNEIEAKRYLLKNARKYKIPRAEIEETELHLKYYLEQLEKYRKDGVL